jgi:hypothetical protein
VKYSAIVRTYLRKIRPKAQAELSWFRDQPSLRAAVENAALARNSNGKRYNHQRRLPSAVLKRARRMLLNDLAALKKADSFDELFTLVESRVRTTPGIGELYVYDTSLRIGAKLNLLPDEVYLHAGVRKGAKALGLDSSARTVRLSQIPHEFRKLEPHEIEDILCIFKAQLAKAHLTANFQSRSWCS